MTGENEEPKGPLVIPSLRIRIARYREQAAHFARLAEGEPVATIRDQWKELARNYAYLASTLESDLSRRSRAARRIDWRAAGAGISLSVAQRAVVRVGYSNLLSLAPPLRGISLIGGSVSLSM
jgi:hypothetical protein